MEIIVVKTDNLSFSELEKYLPLVPPARREVILKKKNDSDKVLSVISGLLLRSELSGRLNLPPKKISFVRGPHGKPYIKGGDIQFSLSHTGGAVCLAVADTADGEIGVDIERSDRKISERLYERALSDNEKMFAQSSEGFLRIWVKKEAFLKRTGIGVATDLKGADTTILPDTADFRFGDYYIGTSGRNAENAKIVELSADELLARFNK